MSNLSKRILSAAFLIPVVLSIVYFSSNLIFILSISLISGLACFELCSISIDRSHKFSILFSSLLCSFLTFSISYFHFDSRIIVFALPFIVTSIFFSFIFLNFTAANLVPILSSSFFSVFYIGVLMGFIGLIGVSPSSFSSSRNIVFLLMLGTFIGDTGAYAFGRFFGKHLLAPKLSPKKTWEGALGGFFSTCFFILLARHFLFPSFSFASTLIFSFLLSVFCQLGDLSESFLKRGFGVKDSGKIIPGHGGILDRIDALLFGAPIVYFFFTF